MPAPIDIAPAPYPPDAVEAGISAVVLLELSLAADGTVVGVSVLESAGLGFDESASEAAADWRFQPALDADGQPVPATIQYRYRFSVEAAPVVSLQGTIRTAGTLEPLA